MKCPKCHAGLQSDQKFCGDCGFQLEKQCPACQLENPPFFKYCGQCGHNLLTTGCVDLDNNGLMSDPDNGLMEILQYPAASLRGKPFSLFVESDDLVVFFSHWNDLLRSRQEQTFEIGLNTATGENPQIQMVLSITKRSLTGDHAIKAAVVDISDRRYALDQVQMKQERLDLIYTIADELHTAHRDFQERTINEILKRLCLFEECDLGFIYFFDRADTVLKIRYQWRRPMIHNQTSSLQTVAVDRVRRLMDRLRQEQMMVVNHMSELSPVERDVLDQWIQVPMDAFVCHLLYHQHRPIGIIGMAKMDSANVWHSDSVALIKLLGQLISCIVFPVSDKTIPKPRTKSRRRAILPPHQDYDDLEAELVASEAELAQTTVLKKETQLRFDTRVLSTDGPAVSIYKRSDGLILLNCPRCGFQQAVPTKAFDENGNRQTAICPKGHRFEVVRELRSMYRKPVELDGFYFQMGMSGMETANESVWGRLVIRDLSRTGIRFLTDTSPTFQKDDHLMVKFNLDNSNRSLIKKPVVVRSVRGSDVGCQFTSQDRYDITLGFYFL